MHQAPALAQAPAPRGAPEIAERPRHPTGPKELNMSRTHTIVSTLLQLITAGILLQTLFFKFTAAEESVYIFNTLGIEPWGRIGSGVMELVASALLLYPPTAAIGALIAMAAMSGAVLSHLTFLGIEVRGDGGLLFALALIVFAASAAIVTLRRTQLPIV